MANPALGPRRSKFVSFVANNGSKIGVLGMALSAAILAMKMSKLEQEVNEHRNGLCGKSDELIAENRRLRNGLIGLRERVIDEVQQDGKKLPPLNTRLKNIFDSVQ